MGCGNLQQLYPGQSEDLWIYGSPNITFFKTVFKRHTNFAMNLQPINFSSVITNGTTNTSYNPSFEKTNETNKVEFGSILSVNIPKSADLLNNLLLCIELPELMEKISFNSNGGYKLYNSDGSFLTSNGSQLYLNNNITQNQVFSWVNGIGHAIIKKIQIYLGGKLIDEHTGDWLEIWDNLHDNYNTSLGKFKNEDWLTKGIYNNCGKLNLVIPLQFWFCRDNGLSLPLIALNNEVIEIKVHLNDLTKCIFNLNIKDNEKELPVSGKQSDNHGFFRDNIYEKATKNIYGVELNKLRNKTQINNIYLLANYIHLDTEERKKFTYSTHEYLIEQTQQIISNDGTTSSLYGNPVKYFSVNTNGSDTNIVKLTGNNVIDNNKLKHPTKILVWFTRKKNSIDSGYIYNFGEFRNTAILNDDLKSDILGTLHYDHYQQKTVVNNLDEYGNLISEKLGVEWHILAESHKSFKELFMLESSEKLNSTTLKGYQLKINEKIRYGYNIDSIDSLQISLLKANKLLFLKNKNTKPDINVLSFSLDACEASPSGAINFSKTNSSSLEISAGQDDFSFDRHDFSDTSGKVTYLYLYAMNYNILRIMSGNSGILYN